ncbi:sugar phosphorylase [Ferrimonas lipolytica]|uniref:Alpha-amylase n=1 Tax=Ferrimonas lipolytica TaxID=2724191 RepID=A0A6H1UCK0_9GAMM|nr:sugar phosphorylase [Ferrimonas lipolytica]QIZ76083.1 alpha-amylase [Ferrimonas lipolytica]
MSSQLNAYQECHHRVIQHLQAIYPDHNHALLADNLIEAMCHGGVCAVPEARTNNWSQQDLILITYGNSVEKVGEPPLRTLNTFLQQHMSSVISGVHILPFFPYSSDDGFSVIDYTNVNPELGDWHDIEAIAKQFDLMSDLVINHCSSQSKWFTQFKQGLAPGKEYFVTVPADTDTSLVVRPRTSPLLQAVDTPQGQQHVWCTFSFDQVDLNFANPDLLFEMVRIIALYLDKGVKIFRLDAVAFLWKQLGSPCINLPQTHEVIRLIRTLVEFRTAAAILITETNIPNQENLSYFGNANEAHCIYNFSLPPLLLHTMMTGSCQHLKQWLMSMPPAQSGTAYFNFIASHDGIGLRPVEGLLETAEIDELAEVMQGFGGAVSWRTMTDGSVRPYEINIALTDAMQGTVNGVDDLLVERFICTHAIMLALEGIPGIYIHSFLGTRNDYAKMAQTGSNRAINRHNWQLETLTQQLEDQGVASQIFSNMKRLCELRQQQPAFNPNATQFTLHLGDQIFAFWRQSMRRDQSIFCLNNVTDRPQRVALTQINLVANERWRDIISGTVYEDTREEIELEPYQSVWLSNWDGAGVVMKRPVGQGEPFANQPLNDPDERRRHG